MQCEFCREAMDDAAVVCPHCRREPAAVRAQRRDRLVFRAMLGVGGLVAAVVVLAAIGGSQSDAERIERACAREYADQLGRLECQNTLMLRELDRREGDKMRDAAAAAGVR